jgi:hypothetical protein
MDPEPSLVAGDQGQQLVADERGLQSTIRAGNRLGSADVRPEPAQLRNSYEMFILGARLARICFKA